MTQFVLPPIFFVSPFMWTLQPSFSVSRKLRVLLLLFLAGGCKQNAKPAFPWRPVEVSNLFFHLSLAFHTVESESFGWMILGVPAWNKDVLVSSDV